LIAQAKPHKPAKHLLVADIGNSSTKLAIWDGTDIRAFTTLATPDSEKIASQITEYWKAMELPRQAIACSVVPERLMLVRKMTKDLCQNDIMVVGQDIPIPLEVKIEKPETVGLDRICCAAAAFFIEGQACAVADLGTAITVDCVNDEGVFIGGAILPGLNMQAQVLAKETVSLPEIVLELPSNPLGQHTVHAIQSGITYGSIGAIKELTERYATLLGKWPVFIVTGGDAKLIYEALNVADKIIPHLGLRGIVLAYEQLFAEP